jgi:hypothetical protein
MTTTSWMIRGVEFGNCNCSWGCPCQFNAPTTHGHCEGFAAGRIDEGYHGETRLDGLNWAVVFWWPGEIAEGNGRFQAIVDERGDLSQREALRRIICGEDTTPGATIFQVFSTTVSEVHDTLYLPIEAEIDVDACSAKVHVPGVIDSVGGPIISPHSGQPHRAQIHLAEGFEYAVAEIGNGNSKITGAIQLELTNSYGQFCVTHMNQDGLIR